jgi:hypothetical protein
MTKNGAESAGGGSAQAFVWCEGYTVAAPSGVIPCGGSSRSPGEAPRQAEQGDLLVALVTCRGALLEERAQSPLSSPLVAMLSTAAVSPAIPHQTRLMMGSSLGEAAEAAPNNIKS